MAFIGGDTLAELTARIYWPIWRAALSAQPEKVDPA